MGAEDQAIEIQLVGQLTSAVEWPKLLAYWERRNPRGVAAWPRQLRDGDYALNLWPLKPDWVEWFTGIAQDVRKRQPTRLACTPGLTRFNPRSGEDDVRTALAVVCAIWLDNVGMNDLPAIRLAPPVLETWAVGGRLIAREVVDFGMKWSLPAADLPTR